MRCCKDCGVELTQENCSPSKWKNNSRKCNTCHNATWTNNPNRKNRDAYHNAHQVYINGEYIKKSDPRWEMYKPGRWIVVGDKIYAKEQVEKGVSGYLYVLKNPAWPDWVKIGLASNKDKRLNSFQTSSPCRDYIFIHTVEVSNMTKCEKIAHKLAAKLGEGNYEWFKITDQQAIEVVEKAAI